MNRIKISPLALDNLFDYCQPATHSAVATANPLTTPATDEFSLFVPLHYEKKYAYPLVVWLHSDGQTADQIQKLMLELSLRNYVGIAPQAPLGDQRTGFFWDQEWDTIDLAHNAVLESIDQAQLRFNVNPRRIFLAGLGSGGTMAFRLAFARPDLFAGVLSINGPLPVEQAPLRDWFRCRELPVFWAHSRRSTEFDQDQLCQQLRLLHIAGFSVTLRQYPQHDLMCPKTMSDMNQWMMEMISSTISNRRDD